MLKINNISKSFGKFKAVNNLNLELKQGELFGFLGPNGAGKTTSIKIMVGLYAADEGTVTIGGNDIVKSPIDAKKQFGYIPDQPFVYEKLTGEEYLFFCGGLYDIPKDEISKTIIELKEKFDIGDWLYKRTEEYSQGMRQRISFASGFIHNPKLLIIDEPMVGLDPKSAFIVKKVLKEEVKNGKTIFMSTHSLNVAEEICSRIGIITNGTLKYNLPSEELFKLKNNHEEDLEKLFLQLTEEELNEDNSSHH